MKPTFRSVLWPTDFSPLSLAAADTAQALAQVFGARLHVVHVVAPLIPDSTIAMETAGDLLVSAADIRGQLKSGLDRLVNDYFGADKTVIGEILVGTPWHEICEYARRSAIELIVLSTHGRTGLKHVLLGSVAERVVQHAHCPVFVVKNSILSAIG
jgi:universal stress protein A